MTAIFSSRATVASRRNHAGQNHLRLQKSLVAWALLEAIATRPVQQVVELAEGIGSLDFGLPLEDNLKD